MAPSKRAQWTEANLRLALQAIQAGKSKNSVSKQFNISRRTLSRYLIKKSTKKQKLGRKSVLGDEQESELASRIIRLATVGYPMTKRILRRCVFNYCEQNRILHPFSIQKRFAGRYWLEAFLKRHPNISCRHAQSMNPARAQKLNKFIVTDYFEKLKTVLLELDLIDKPERIFNVDEKGCRLTLHHQQTVLAQKGAKRVHLVAPEHGENVTVVSCGNASGGRIPPAILFKGQRLKPEWRDHLPPGTLTLMTKKGSMTVDSFNEWIKHLAKYKLPGKCLLIFDGASCHLDTSIVETADSCDITLFCLPSNTTHELQPMDKAVFKSFEYYWDEQVLLYWTRYKDRTITKQRFGEIFSIVWDKAVTPQNIKSGFSATGIYPFNPNAIAEIAFAPSILTQMREVEENKHEEGSRPQESLEKRNSSPQPGPSGYQRSIEHTPPAMSAKPPKSLEQKRQRKRRWSSSSSDTSDEDLISVYSETLSETFTSDEEIRAEGEDKEAEVEDREAEVEDREAEVDEVKVQKVAKIISNADTVQEKKIINKICSNSVETKDRPNNKEQEDQIKQTQAKNSDENEAQVDLNVSFTEMLETPYKNDVQKRNRRKAINSRALIVTRNVFSDKKEKTLTKKHQRKPNTKSTKQGQKSTPKESWFCKICQEDVQRDMRLCTVCLVYMHEECVGLTKNDKSIFICPLCSDIA